MVALAGCRHWLSGVAPPVLGVQEYWKQYFRDHTDEREAPACHPWAFPLGASSSLLRGHSYAGLDGYSCRELVYAHDSLCRLTRDYALHHSERRSTVGSQIRS